MADEEQLKLWKYSYNAACIDIPRYSSPTVYAGRPESFCLVASDRESALERLAKIRQKQIKDDLRGFSEYEGIEEVKNDYTSELRTLDKGLSEFSFTVKDIPIVEEDVHDYTFSLSIKPR